MCIHKIESDKVPIKLWVQLETVEEQALKQLHNIASLPWAFHHVAVMPDVHYGKGATVGSVIATLGAISPAAVGVDIGCGMAAVRTNLGAEDLPESLSALRADIESAIPVGFNKHAEPVVSELSARSLMSKVELLSKHATPALVEKAWQQCGTLGGGNHFIEVCLDTDNTVWLMLHSGSRNIGKELASRHIEIAQGLAHNSDLPDKDLAAFMAETEEMKAYMTDLEWCQEFAFLNRSTMLGLLVDVMRKHFPQIKTDDPITCHHNYVSRENHFGSDVVVTRKGAIAANRGQLGIIPGSMGAKSFIVEGLGNHESFCSASHGAGRKMSRGAAKRAFTIADMESQTAGVECRKDIDVLDEIPAAYKDIETVMHNQRDLVKIKHELKQVLCVKG